MIPLTSSSAIKSSLFIKVEALGAILLFASHLFGKVKDFCKETCSRMYQTFYFQSNDTPADGRGIEFPQRILLWPQLSDLCL